MACVRARAQTTFDAPPGTPAHDAQAIYDRDFSDKPQSAIMLIHNTAGNPIVNEFTQDASQKLESALNGWNAQAQFYQYVALGTYYDIAPAFRFAGAAFISADNS